MIEKKERYIVTLDDGKEYNALCASFSECIQAFGEENIRKMEKLDYEEEE
ncbi:MAG: hypothetical protein IJV40_03480 [Oscillospiraceae bacterium]|nr:hypothetical protein [Oscillospiraceae bacterium]